MKHSMALEILISINLYIGGSKSITADSRLITLLALSHCTKVVIIQKYSLVVCMFNLAIIAQMAGFSHYPSVIVYPSVVNIITIEKDILSFFEMETNTAHRYC